MVSLSSSFEIKNFLKSLLFSTTEPISIRDIQKVIERYHLQDRSEEINPILKDRMESTNDISDENNNSDSLVPTMLTASQIRNAMEELSIDVTSQNDVFLIDEGVNGYKMVLKPDYAVWVRLLRDEPKPQKLSQVVMETLAIIGYRQPVTRAEIESIRGVSSDSAVTKLLEHEFIYVSGRAELPGRPTQFSTTDKFLDYCGIKSTDELPASDVLAPNQLTELIQNASKKEIEVSDSEVGLPEEDGNFEE